MSGTYTKHPYGEWVAYEFTDNGTVKTTEGLVDALAVSAGVTGHRDTGQAPVAGTVVESLLSTTSGSHTVTIGQPGAAGAAAGGSTVGSFTTRWTVPVQNGSAGGTHQGAGATAGSDGKGIHSSITGVDVEYGMASGHGNHGSVPGDTVKTTPGSSNDESVGTGVRGVVVIKVPLSHASNVIENFYRWLTFATVTDGVVTSVERVPDNEPHTLDAEWLPAPDGVQVGWSYTDGEFIPPPPPTREDLISELQNRIDDLHRGE